jgi:hypothetical protein
LLFIIIIIFFFSIFIIITTFEHPFGFATYIFFCRFFIITIFFIYFLFLLSLLPSSFTLTLSQSASPSFSLCTRRVCAPTLRMVGS